MKGTATEADSGPLPIPEGWQYGVKRDEGTPYEEYILISPTGERFHMWMNGLDFWSDTQGFLTTIRRWVEETTHARDGGGT